LSGTIILGCKAPVFAPRCDTWDNETGCTKGSFCSYQYDYQDYQEMLRDSGVVGERVNDK